MAVSSLPSSTQAPWQNMWNSLTKPADQLDFGDKPRARLLAAVLMVMVPLVIITIIFSPILDLTQNKPIEAPNIGSTISLVLLLAAYFFSRSRYYRFGAWLVVLVPIAAILPVYIGTVNSVIPLFFLSLAVIIAGLLLEHVWKLGAVAHGR